MKKILTFALIGLNLLGLSAGAYFTLSAVKEPILSKPVTPEKNTEEFLTNANIFKDKPIIYSLDVFTVNLANVEEDKKVLVELSLELNDEKSFQEVKDNSPAVRDAVVSILSKHEYADIATIQGKLSLKDEISLAINRQLKDSMIRGVYFTKFFVE
jgi:flagellar basal body-associated protein FliL